MNQQQQSGRSPLPGRGVSPGLTVALPPPRNQPSPQPTSTSDTTISPPPPRPPPPRQSTSSSSSITPPSLPPKQYTRGSVRSGGDHQGVNALNSSGIPLNLPPPLVPTQVNNPQGSQQHASLPTPPPPPPRTTNPFLPTFTVPAIPVANTTTSTTTDGNGDDIVIRRPETDSQEAADNASNECTVCWEKPPNCVIYTCGHMCMCYECAVDIKNNQGALCPICRQEIKDIIKIFKS